MKKTIFVIMIVTILSKIAGFVRELILAYYYGASNISDAFIISLTIPGVLFSIIGGAIVTGYIPMYTRIVKKKSIETGYEFTNKLVNFMIVFSFVVILIIILFTKQIILIFASGFDSETLNVTIKLTRMISISLLFTSVVHILSGFLRVNQKYIIPSLIGIPLNIILIISIIISNKYQLKILAIGTVIAYLSQVVLLLPFVIKLGYQFKLDFLIFKDKNISRIIVLGIPIMIGTSIEQVNLIVDRTIASQVTIGGISALNYAGQINLVVQGVFVVSIMSILYPQLADKVVNKANEEIKEVLSRTIKAFIVIILPITLFTMNYSKNIVELLFFRGSFDQTATFLTSGAVFYYSFGMLAFALREVFTKYFYANQNTKLPLVNGFIGIIINIILNIILSRYLGVGGLALATSISAIITAFLMFISFNIKTGGLKGYNIIITLVKVLIITLIALGLSNIVQIYFINFINKSGAFLVCGLSFVTAYLLLIKVFKIQSFNFFKVKNN